MKVRINSSTIDNRIKIRSFYNDKLTSIIIFTEELVKIFSVQKSIPHLEVNINTGLRIKLDNKK
jgi:hypothetical protein